MLSETQLTIHDLHVAGRGSTATARQVDLLPGQRPGVEPVVVGEGVLVEVVEHLELAGGAG